MLRRSVLCCLCCLEGTGVPVPTAEIPADPASHPRSHHSVSTFQLGPCQSVSLSVGLSTMLASPRGVGVAGTYVRHKISGGRPSSAQSGGGGGLKREYRPI